MAPLFDMGTRKSRIVSISLSKNFFFSSFLSFLLYFYTFLRFFFLSF